MEVLRTRTWGFLYWWVWAGFVLHVLGTTAAVIWGITAVMGWAPTIIIWKFWTLGFYWYGLPVTVALLCRGGWLHPEEHTINKVSRRPSVAWNLAFVLVLLLQVLALIHLGRLGEYLVPWAVWTGLLTLLFHVRDKGLKETLSTVGLIALIVIQVVLGLSCAVLPVVGALHLLNRFGVSDWLGL